MESIVAITGILFACLMGSISPGPSFLLVARISISESRRNGIAAAAGMGIGGMLLSILALLGLKAIFASFPIFYSGIKMLGGIYLVYIGIQIWRGAKETIYVQSDNAAKKNTAWRAFFTALFTQLSNPKAVVFYGSIFAALLPQTVSKMLTIILPVCVLLIETGWYCIVALVLSATGPRSVYLRTKVWIDRVAGGVMGMLGVKLITSSDIIG